MNKDYELLQIVLDTFGRMRTWVNPDYYREQVMPTVKLIKDRLAVIETDYFLEQKRQRYKSAAEDQERIRQLEQLEPDTIPDKLLDATSNFGLFNDRPE